MTSTESENTFLRDWVFPSKVRETISYAGFYEVNPIPGAFKSGRPKYECTFMIANRTKVIATRLAMELTSKKTGKPYFVYRRENCLMPDEKRIKIVVGTLLNNFYVSCLK